MIKTICMFNNHDYKLVAMKIVEGESVRFFKCVKCGDRTTSSEHTSSTIGIENDWNLRSKLPDNIVDPIQLSYNSEFQRNPVDE